MALSKKDYVKAAKIVSRLYQEDREESVRQHGEEILQRPTVRWAPRALLAENCFVEFFQGNPGFDANKFRAACRVWES